MHRRRLLTGLLVALVGTLVVPAAHAGAHRQYLDAYHARVSTADLATLRAQGFDVTELNVTGRYSKVELIMTRTEASLLAKRGIRARVLRHNGRTTSRRSALAATSGYTVFRPYSGPGGIEQELRSLVLRYPDIATLVRIGWTVQHKPILAVRVTTRSRREDDSKPVVLYAATQHAREWIATETDRRLLHYYLEQYATNPTVRRLVQTRELWFVPVANPDGYDYTFTPGNRLWRKNLRDNNNDGSIDPTTDGVDPNRNFATNWNYDDEGSSGDPGSETYRGTAPNSEPETRAMDGLVRHIRPVFMINYHSAAELLLYPYGFQEDTATDDNPIFLALSGTDGPDPTTQADDNAAVPGYDPDVGAELYITNGETTDHVYARYGTLAWTPELDTAQSYGAPSDVSVFEFPEDEAKVQAVFEKNIPFALNVATSAADPGHPRASAQNPSTAYQVPATPDFVVSPFSTSYGNPQVVEADARRSLGDVTLRYRINGGRWHEADAHDSRGGSRYDAQRGHYYHKVRAAVRGAHAGDDVEVTFVARHSASTPFTYHVAYDGGASVLLVAAEDYTGRSPGGPYDGPLYLGLHDAALTADGIPHAIYDIDAMRRVAPDPLGVLSHFKAVVWYTGDDLLVREPSQGAGTSSKLAHEETLAMRQYLNEGGRLLYAGRNAGYGSFNGYPYFPDNTAPVPLSDDFYQYWLGAYAYQSGNDTGLVDGQQVVASGTPFSFDPFVPDAQGGLDQPVPVRAHEEHPRPRHLSAVRQHRRRQVLQRRAVRRAADRGLVPGLCAAPGPELPAARPHHLRPRRHDDPRPAGVVLHRAGLGLHDRRGPHRRAGRLDDAGRPERPHLDRPRPELPRRLGHPAPAARPLPDARRHRPGQPGVHADRYDRLVERDDRRLGRLGAAVVRPLGVGGQGRRGVDLLRHRLEHRRHRRPDRRCGPDDRRRADAPDRLRDRSGRVHRARRAARQRRQPGGVAPGRRPRPGGRRGRHRRHRDARLRARAADRRRPQRGSRPGDVLPAPLVRRHGPPSPTAEGAALVRPGLDQGQAAFHG